MKNKSPKEVRALLAHVDIVNEILRRPELKSKYIEIYCRAMRKEITREKAEAQVRELSKKIFN